MKRAASWKQHWTIRIAAVLFCMVLITTWMTSGLYARYASQDQMADLARTAAFVFDIEDTEGNFQIPVTDITKPGDDSVCTFVVKNSHQNIVSDVEQEYTVTVKLNGSMPLDCVLQKADSEVAAFLVEETRNLAQVTEQSKNSEAYVMKASVKTEDTYTLTVNWPASENDAKYANGTSVAQVQLMIECVQVD